MIHPSQIGRSLNIQQRESFKQVLKYEWVYLVEVDPEDRQTWRRKKKMYASSAWWYTPGLHSKTASQKKKDTNDTSKSVRTRAWFKWQSTCFMSRKSWVQTPSKKSVPCPPARKKVSHQKKKMWRSDYFVRYVAVFSWIISQVCQIWPERKTVTWPEQCQVKKAYLVGSEDFEEEHELTGFVF